MRTISLDTCIQQFIPPTRALARSPAEPGNARTITATYLWAPSPMARHPLRSGGPVSEHPPSQGRAGGAGNPGDRGKIDPETLELALATLQRRIDLLQQNL